MHNQPMILETRHLLVLQAIAREGGVTAAAKRLALTQPAVSHTVRNLEGRLGVRLFDRRNRRMVPTQEGIHVLETADVVLERIKRTEQDLQKFRDGKRGILRIATQCYTCYYWLPRTLARFHKSFPDVDLQLVPEATRSTTEALLAEKIDVAILHEVPPQAEIAADHLFDDEVVVVFSPNHKLAGRAWVGPHDFAGEHLLLHSSPEESLLLNRYLLPAGVKPKRMSQLSLTEAIFETAKAGLGISAVAKWMVSTELAKGGLVCARLKPRGFKRSWYAAVRRRRPESAPTNELIRLLKQEFAATSGEFTGER